MMDATNECELSIVMPCLNEALTLATCIRKARGFLERAGIVGEVVVADNGSTDGSQDIARAEGARVVDIEKRGYGAAVLGGLLAGRGRYLIMADSDDSYDFSRLDDFVAKLREGYDLVMGNRFLGGIDEGAMPPLHRYLGNPVLTGIGKLFFSSRCGDFHCGLRGLSKAALEMLDLRTTGMEIASEMVVKASLLRLRVAEVPTRLAKDGRDRPPHLRSWRDGWRHLRFLLMYAPRWLFLYPGLVLSGLGVLLMIAVLPGPLTIGGSVLDVHTLLIAMGWVLVGAQFVIGFLLAKQFAINHGLLPIGPRFATYRVVMSLERWLVGGLVLIFLGLVGVLAMVASWRAVDFGALDYRQTMRLLVPSLTVLVLGVQLTIAAFLYGILDLGLQDNGKIGTSLAEDIAA